MIEEFLHYRIEAKIGEGGMGEVYRAHDKRLNRTVALKFLPTDEMSNPDARRRFLREARAASGLNHNNIAVIHDIEDSAEHTCIAMEYVPGKTIRDRLKEGPFSIPEALDVTAQIADALNEAHTKLVVHRDIKSANVVIKPGGLVKVLDFGLAKFQLPTDVPESQLTTQSTLTKAGTTMGTVAYMSPEQMRNEEVDGRSDIFSLGVLFYEMLSGTRPFDRKTQAEHISATLSDAPVSLHKLVPNCPPAVERIVEKSLSKDQGDRYQSAADLREDLLKVQREIAAGQPGLRDTVIRLSRRPAVRVVAAVLVLTLVVGAIVEAPRFLAIRRAASPATAGIKRIAVLPIHQLKNDEESAFLTSALTESLITDLIRTDQFTVMTERATERYRDSTKDERTIGNELGTDGLLEVSLQDNAGQLKVTLSLVRCSDGVAVWRDEFTMADRSLFAVQDKLSERVGGLMGMNERDSLAKLRTRPSQNQEAYRYYEYGKTMVFRPERRLVDSAIEQYKKAIEADPGFALAYTGLSTGYSNYITYDWETDTKWLDMADEAAKHALALDGNLAEAHYALGRVHMMRCRLYVGGCGDMQQETERALQLDPFFAPALNQMGVILNTKFQLTHQKSFLEEALKYYERANDIEPGTGVYDQNIALILAHLGRFDEAIKYTNRLAQNEPLYFAPPAVLSYIFFLKKDYAEAVTQQEKSVNSAPSEQRERARLAAYLAAFGDRKRALEELQKLEVGNARSPVDQRDISIFLASAYAGIGDQATSLKYLEEFASTGSRQPLYVREGLFFIETDTNFDSLRQDPHYQELVRRMKDHYIEGVG